MEGKRKTSGMERGGNRNPKHGGKENNEEDHITGAGKPVVETKRKERRDKDGKSNYERTPECDPARDHIIGGETWSGPGGVGVEDVDLQAVGQPVVVGVPVLRVRAAGRGARPSHPFLGQS